jgi:hypothetical protein
MDAHTAAPRGSDARPQGGQQEAEVGMALTRCRDSTNSVRRRHGVAAAAAAAAAAPSGAGVRSSASGASLASRGGGGESDAEPSRLAGGARARRRRAVVQRAAVLRAAQRVVEAEHVEHVPARQLVQPGGAAAGRRGRTRRDGAAAQRARGWQRHARQLRGAAAARSSLRGVVAGAALLQQVGQRHARRHRCIRNFRSICFRLRPRRARRRLGGRRRVRGGHGGAARGAPVLPQRSSI